MSAKRVKSIRLIQIEAFLAVVDRQSFTEAAALLGCNQSTVSKYIDDLGDLMGAPLLHFGTALPSAAGTIFVPVARTVIEAIAASKTQISDLLQSRHPTIRARELKV